MWKLKIKICVFVVSLCLFYSYANISQIVFLNIILILIHVVMFLFIYKYITKVKLALENRNSDTILEKDKCKHASDVITLIIAMVFEIILLGVTFSNDKYNFLSYIKDYGGNGFVSLVSAIIASIGVVIGIFFSQREQNKRAYNDVVSTHRVKWLDETDAILDDFIKKSIVAFGSKHLSDKEDKELTQSYYVLITRLGTGVLYEHRVALICISTLMMEKIYSHEPKKNKAIKSHRLNQELFSKTNKMITRQGAYREQKIDIKNSGFNELLLYYSFASAHYSKVEWIEISVDASNSWARVRNGLEIKKNSDAYRFEKLDAELFEPKSEVDENQS